MTEGLGHKNLIAEWMYGNAGTGGTYHGCIGEDVMLMAVNDLKGALPVIYTDEVALQGAANGTKTENAPQISFPVSSGSARETG